MLNMPERNIIIAGVNEAIIIGKFPDSPIEYIKLEQKYIPNPTIIAFTINLPPLYRRVLGMENIIPTSAIAI